MPKKIEMIVTPAGEIQIKTTGYKGKECLKATAELEKALGTVAKDEATPEMMQKEATQNVDAR